MTPDLIQRLRELYEKATPGEWLADDFCEHNGERTRVGTTDGSETYYHRSQTIARCTYSTKRERDEALSFETPDPDLLQAEFNAKFIAAVKNAFPALLSAAEARPVSTDLVARLRDKLTRYSDDQFGLPRHEIESLLSAAEARPVSSDLVQRHFIGDSELMLGRVALAARAYRAAETDGTPRMWRGKALQDLANELDAALAALFPEEEDMAGERLSEEESRNHKHGDKEAPGPAPSTSKTADPVREENARAYISRVAAGHMGSPEVRAARVLLAHMDGTGPFPPSPEQT